MVTFTSARDLGILTNSGLSLPSMITYKPSPMKGFYTYIPPTVTDIKNIRTNLLPSHASPIICSPADALSDVARQCEFIYSAQLDTEFRTTVYTCQFRMSSGTETPKTHHVASIHVVANKFVYPPHGYNHLNSSVCACLATFHPPSSPIRRANANAHSKTRALNRTESQFVTSASFGVAAAAAAAANVAPKIWLRIPHPSPYPHARKT